MLAWLLNLGFAASGVDAPAPPVVTVDHVSGGWEYYVRAEQESLRREARRRRKKELEEAEQALKDETDRQIAQLIHAQEAIDEARDERERLRSLAASYSDSVAVTERVRAAMSRVLADESSSALEALGREIERQRDDEDIAALMILLNQ